MAQTMRPPNRRLQSQKLKKLLRKQGYLMMIATMKNINLKKRLKSLSTNLKLKALMFNRILKRLRRRFRRLKRKSRRLIRKRKKKKN